MINKKYLVIFFLIIYTSTAFARYDRDYLHPVGNHKEEGKSDDNELEDRLKRLRAVLNDDKDDEDDQEQSFTTKPPVIRQTSTDGTEQNHSDNSQAQTRPPSSVANNNHGKSQTQDNNEFTTQNQDQPRKYKDQSNTYQDHPRKNQNPFFNSIFGNNQAQKNNLFGSNFDITKMLKDILNPTNLLPSSNGLVKRFHSFTDFLIPKPLRLNHDNMIKTTEWFSRLLTQDMPNLIDKTPESIQGVIDSLDSMRINNTELAQNQNRNLFNTLTKNLFIWALLVSQTDLMATVTLGLVFKGAVHILKATPLPTEAMKMQTELNHLTLRLTEVLPIAVKVLSHSLSWSTNNSDLINDLKLLKQHILSTNNAIEVLKNQTKEFQEKIEAIPTTSKIFQKRTSENFQNSLVELIETSSKVIPDSLPDFMSLLFTPKSHLMDFVTNLGQTFIEGGFGLKGVDSFQKLLEINVGDSPFLNNSQLGVARLPIKLLSALQLIFSSFLKPRNLVSAKSMTLAIDIIIESVRALKKVNINIPLQILEPVLFMLENIIKFIPK